jgi:predicted nuclease of predicted toxin-antitoxin system
MADRPVIRFLLDNNAPDSIRGRVEAHGVHSVTSVRDHLMHDATDDQIAATAVDNDLVLITWDRDFRIYLQQVPVTQAEPVPGGVVRIRTPELIAADRFASCLDIVEFHYSDVRSRKVRLRLDIGRDYTTVYDLPQADFSDLVASIQFHYERSLTNGYTTYMELTPNYWKFNERKPKKGKRPVL